MSIEEKNLFKIFINRLNANNFSYVVTGSVASIVYGEPRLTLDVDIVVNISKRDIEKLMKSFPAEKFYLPDIDILTIEVNRGFKGNFNIIHNETGFKADIYLVGNDKFQEYALEHKNIIDFDGDVIAVAPIEYVIIKKIEYYIEGGSEKHLIDIKNMIKNSKYLIDEKVIEQFAGTNIIAIWKQLKNAVETKPPTN